MIIIRVKNVYLSLSFSVSLKEFHFSNHSLFWFKDRVRDTEVPGTSVSDMMW